MYVGDSPAMSAFGYNLPSEPSPRHVWIGPSFGHSFADVGFAPIFVRITPDSGRS